MLRRRLFKIVLIGLLLRVGGMVLTRPYRATLERNETAHVAASIAAGQGFSNPFGPPTGPTAWLGPVFPYVLSRFFVVFGSYSRAAIVWATLLNCLVSAATCVPIYFIASHTFGERIAERSAWVWTLFPYAMYWELKILWETSLSALLLALLFMMTLQLSSAPRRWALYGLVWGVAGLTNPAELAFLPFAGSWVAYHQFRQGKPVLRNVTVGAALFLATVTPWTVRNYRIFHKLIPIRDNFGVEFHLGNTPDARGIWQVWLHPSQNVLELKLYQQMGESAYVHSKLEQTLRFVHDQPGRFAYLSILHFIYYWAGPPHAEKYPGMYEAKTFLFLTWSVLAFWGLFIALRQALPGASLYLLLLLTYPTIYYITFPHLRYRHPVEPQLLILVVFLVSQIGIKEAKHLREARAATILESMF